MKSQQHSCACISEVCDEDQQLACEFLKNGINISSGSSSIIEGDAPTDLANEFFGCCPKCHFQALQHRYGSSLTDSIGSNTNSGQWLDSKGNKIPPIPLPAAFKNLQHSCTGHLCFQHKHPNYRINHHQVKMRLKEKSKKKKEEMEKCLIQKNESNFVPPIDHQSTPTKSSTDFIEKNEGDLTTEHTIIQQQQGRRSSSPYFIASGSFQKIIDIGTEMSSFSPTHSNASLASLSSKVSSSTFPSSTSNNQIPSLTINQHSNCHFHHSQHQNFLNIDLKNDCTKTDDCQCMDCKQRRKLAAELIAEEESIKKKKQKKKKKSKESKQENNKAKQQSSSKKNQNELTCKRHSLEEKNAVHESKSIENDNNRKGINCILTFKSSDSDKKEIQINKKSGEWKQTINENNNVIDHKNTFSFDKENELSKITSINEIENSTSIGLQQWIKVKNGKFANIKQCQQSLEENPVEESDVDEDQDGVFHSVKSNEKQIDLLETKISPSTSLANHIDHQPKQTNSNQSKIIPNNQQTTSSNAVTVLVNNPVAKTQKAKLLAIEAQVAFNNNEIKSSVQFISEAIQLDPKNPTYLINRAFYHEKLTEFEHALKDAEFAINLMIDNFSNKDYLDHALSLKAKALDGLKRFEEAEEELLSLKQNLAHKPIMPVLEKNLMLIRFRKLISVGFEIPISRLYAERFLTINDALTNIDKNRSILKQKKLSQDDLDVQLHLMLIQNQGRIHKNWKEISEENVEAAANYITILSNDFDDDEEIYFSDEDERDLWYGHPDNWHQSKDVLKKYPMYIEDTKEILNSKGHKALWIGNVSPNSSVLWVQDLFMKFGNVTFCKIYPNERTPDLGYLLLHFDNDISPRLVMAYFKDRVIPGLSKNDNCPLLIRFRNKTDQDMSDGSAVAAASPGSGFSTVVGSPGPRGNTSECYYWRTTGCDRSACSFKHIQTNKGIDRQSWMRKRN